MQLGLVVRDVLISLAQPAMPRGGTESPEMPPRSRGGDPGCCDLSSFFLLLHRWIEVLIPKFSISASYDLETILPKMGIQHAFDKNAHFSGITKKDFLWVSKVSWSMKYCPDWKGL